MAIKKIELDRVERKNNLPSLKEVQEIDKSVKRIVRIALTDDKMVVEVETSEAKPKPKRKPNALKEVSKSEKKPSLGKKKESE